ncbi:MAG: S-layer homology domain-containing protein [Lachnospiraceae bacterium]
MKGIKKTGSKVLSAILAAALLAGGLPQIPAAEVKAEEAFSGTLTSVDSASADKNIVTVNFNDGVQAKITFLDDGIFRYNVDPSGEFSEYATMRYGDTDIKIPQYPDSSDEYSHPEAAVSEADDCVVITSGDTTIKFEKATAKMTVEYAGSVVMQESEALSIGKQTTQSLVKHDGENFFGGGTQNGRFVHTGKTISIVNESSWTDGGVASPNPFYYTTEGYGVLRNTFLPGEYRFGSTQDGVVETVHNEKEFDAYYFLSDGENSTEVVRDILDKYYHVTGNPILLPEYAFYEGHLNAYNRDSWSDTSGSKKWEIMGSNASDGSEGALTTYYESGMSSGYRFPEGAQAESLNGKGPTVATNNYPESVTTPYKYSARAVIDQYVEMDMPLGYFLPNDGYGAGYGQNGYYMQGGVNAEGNSSAERIAAVDANVQNLKEFTEYARSKGVETGLWTQSYLTPDSNPNTYWHLLRDFNKEVTVGGVTTLKTDVAWVGYGYDMALNAQKTGYDTVTTGVNYRPNLISLDGWAGSQRFSGIWSGDQYGGNWEYIRFHIPTYIGQSLSGNPNIGCDMDGIFSGKALITTRDTQWKIFTPTMLNMDGWGSYAKTPHTFGDPYTGINRMYLKLKAQLLPYIYTSAASAANIDTGNDDTGLPMIRAMFLEYPDDEYAATRNMQYQYMFGKNVLVAPVYTETDAIDAMGNDVRNGIYLPDEDQIWIDYFTGDQYYGGQVLNNFDAPIWKLPVFVKNGAIIPMWEENNNPASIDKANRIVEFWPAGSTEYTLFEDDGTYVENDQTDVEGYGKVNDISYGDHVSTKYTSVVENGTATLTAEKSTGTYRGYNKDKNTTFVVNVSKEPSKVTAVNGDTALTMVAADSKEAVLNAEVEAGTFVFYYDAAPAIETYAVEGEDEFAAMMEGKVSSPKLYVKFAETDSQENAQVLTLEGFENTDDKLPEYNGLNKDLPVPANLHDVEEAKTPTSNTVAWDAVELENEVEETAARAAAGFEDVNEDDFFYNAVLWAVENEITNGWTDTTFAPDETCTRAQIVTFLHRAAGTPEATAEVAFDDVEEGSYYADAVAWAVENEITNGWTDTTFAPNETCTRAQVVTFLHRAAGTPAATADAAFDDVEEGAYYAEAVAWAVENKVTNGVTETTFEPHRACTRGEIVTFLYNAANGGSGDVEIGEFTYEIKVDGVVNNVGTATSFAHVDQPYDSEHTYAVRIRTNKGYSEWSEEITARTALDPWRNVPAAKITWTGGDDWGALGYATDHDTSTMFHSTGNVVTDAVPFIFDFGDAYQLDEFEYYPRDNYGNGTVSQMDVYTSLDGAHWTKVHDGASDVWTYDKAATVVDNVKTVDLSGYSARFVKLIVTESIGSFFSANELAVYKKDGTSAFAVGSTGFLPEVSDADYTNMKNYLGTSVKDASNFIDQIQKRAGDINMNDVYDVYDYAFTMFKLDGGTKQTGRVSGSGHYNVSAESLKAGETLTIEVAADKVKNLNAFGQVLNYDPAALEFVSVTAGEMLGEMEDLNVNKVYEDGTAYFNLAYANRGDQALVSGSGVLATITMKAKADVADVREAIDLSGLTLIGPDFSFIEVEVSAGPALPELSEGNVTKYGKDKIATMSITNSSMPEDDGSNVGAIIQQGSFNGLFDGKMGRDFEFLWDIESNYVDGALPDYVTLPATMTFEMKEAVKLNEVTVYNANKSNGYATEAEAVLKYSDGTESEKQTIEITDKVDYAAFKFAWTGCDKEVTAVKITILDANGVKNMLTLAEIELAYNDFVAVEDICSEGNTAELAVGEKADIVAKFTPENATNPYFKAVSSNPSVVRIDVVADEDGYAAYQAVGVSEGSARITLIALENEDVTVAYDVTVK